MVKIAVSEDFVLAETILYLLRVIPMKVANKIPPRIIFRCLGGNCFLFGECYGLSPMVTFYTSC